MGPTWLKIEFNKQAKKMKIKSRKMKPIIGVNPYGALCNLELLCGIVQFVEGEKPYTPTTYFLSLEKMTLVNY